MEDDWDPKQYEIGAFCSLLENPRAPVELARGSSGLLALLMGSYLGVGRFPGGDGASRSGF